MEKDKQYKEFVNHYGYMLNPKELEKIIRTRNKSMSENMMYKMKNLKPGELEHMIEIESEEFKNQRNRTNFPLINNVEYDIKNSRTNIDSKEKLFPKTENNKD